MASRHCLYLFALNEIDYDAWERLIDGKVPDLKIDWEKLGALTAQG
jgi:hypothetical protein